MKAVVYSLGCKVNQIEGQSIIAKFVSNGIRATDKLENADIFVINTCSVTIIADRKSRQTVAKVLKLNPNAKIYICGCSSQNSANAYKKMSNIKIISGTSSKQALVDHIMHDITGIVGVNKPPEEYEDDLLTINSDTRAFVKIQDGCNNFCSYCIVPYLRGRSRSRNLDSIVKEAHEQAETCNEIVLSGINISDYGKNIGLTLTDLVKALKDVKVRKRFGSLECTVIDDNLLKAMQDSNFCDHFHLSLQSGCYSVLKRMNRHYDTDFFLSKVNLIRKFFPFAGITTDIIAGFAEESEEEHLQTMSFLKKVRFSDAHVFPYSERFGTKAYTMRQIDKPVRDIRAAQITELKNVHKAEFINSILGKNMEICVCDKEKDFNIGITSNYIKVFCDLPLGSTKSVVLDKAYKDGILFKK